jgi:tetratricopeptide (TPR) repeat protein
MPTTAETLATALEHHRAGRLAEAEPLYRQILAHDPAAADAWHFLGALYLQSARFGEAVEHLQRAVALRPAASDFYSHLGAAYSGLARHDEAIAALRRAVQLAPRSASAHYNLGTALRNAGRLDQAVASFQHAVAADPQGAEAFYNLANTLVELERLDEAEVAYRQALAARSGYLKAMTNLGNLLCRRERIDEALAMFEAAVAADASYAPAQLNLGTILRDVGRYDEAIASLRRAVALDPASAEAHNVLGTALQSQARWPEAQACYQQALRLNPELGDAHFSSATFRIRQGDVQGGLAEYEWRLQCKGFCERRFNAPRWDGSPLAGRTILLHAEQGLGDTLQFIRYAADVKAQGATVVVECQKPLAPLLATVAGIDALVAAGEALPAYDLECSLMSLPHKLGLSETQLARDPYLVASRERVERWRGELAAIDGFRIGVCWQGNAKHVFDRQRSFALERLAPLAAVPGVRLISLQKGAGSEQLAACPFEVIDLGPRLDEGGAFLETAAVIANLDLVITSDTAIAHLAGGLGAPVWLALSAHCDWRWMLDRSDSPWYPSMRLFRQSQLGHWDEVFARVAAEVARLVSRG